ncbi:iron-sulfur cluster assembly scaffold protein [Leptospira levettii]|uniref:Iron-sulfur cluster assembly scaffold protein n=1 Tax=Leptospira levettii TaxID=2023178 RepID=A0AAW5V541_9LEPT|nr:iron-sulfur cluster assembly scaffold protein [Leptospira levettii]MCW7466326.1 iron-sulfur cluster assembly scaffold protein [Leptospira levettii]MCW7512149.1 iron-sulfur cluster assembly scaffold protein [Leptospira levettii]MCW7516157.1 iron-sulfur cluster assembly scaffold protein [Leptospira levettii]
MSSENNTYQDFLKWKSYALWQKPKETVLEVSSLNPLCGDEVKLYYREEGKDSIRIFGVSGESCSICSASIGFLFKHQTELQKDNFLTYLSERKNFLEGDETSLFGDLEEITFFRNVKTHPSRYRCALLPWQTLLKIIEVNHDPRS